MTTSIAKKRIKRELCEIMTEKPCEFKLIPVNDNLANLNSIITGPKDTPYEGGKFNLELIIPDGYPFSPPKVRFLTKIWHPNISSVTGAICLDILKENWAAAMSLRTVLLSLQALMSAPEPSDPQDAVVAKQYINDYDSFVKTAQYWTGVHAGGPIVNKEFDGFVHKLIEMGVDEASARVALSSCNWDLNKATEKIFD